MKCLTIASFIFIGITSLFASELYVEGSSIGILDNLEYTHGAGKSGTFFGTMNGVVLRYNLNSKNSIRGGLFYLHEFGSDISSEVVRPLISYRYSSERRMFLFGSVIRSDLIAPYPIFLLSDKFSHKKPLFEGFFLKRKFSIVDISVWADWIGLQSPSVHEEFLLGTDINLHIRKFLLKINYLYNHIASRTALHDPVKDESGLNVLTSFSWKRLWILDSLSLSAELLATAVRDRKITMEYDTPLGIKAGTKIVFNKFSIGYFHYQGVIEGDNGWHNLSKGDMVYKNRSFDQVDLSVIPVKNRFVEMFFDLSLISVGGGIDHRENFNLKVPIKSRIGKWE